MNKIRNQIGEVSGRLNSNSPKPYRGSIDFTQANGSKIAINEINEKKLPAINESELKRKPSEVLKQIQSNLQIKLKEDRILNSEFKRFKKNNSLYKLHGESMMSIDSRLGL